MHTGFTAPKVINLACLPIVFGLVWHYMRQIRMRSVPPTGIVAPTTPGKIKAMEQAAASEVSMLLKSMEMERVLAAFFPEKTLEDFLSQERSEVEAKIGDAKKALVDRIMVVIDTAKSRKEREAAGGNKFTTELKGGSVDTFLGGVTGLVGEPHPDIERGMAEEHLDKPDSHTGFTASNYPVSTTPAIEFAVVLNAMGITTGPASKIMKEKLEEWKELKCDGWLARAKAACFQSGFRKKTITDHGKTW